MPSPSPSVAEILHDMREDSSEHATDEAQQQRVATIARLASRDPMQVATELLRTQQRLKEAQKKCSVAAEAASNLESMLEELLQGNRLLCRLVTFRETQQGPSAICRANGTLRELPIHPTVDIDQLRSLQPWEYVMVREQVVVGVWRDEPYLFASAR